MIHKTLAELIGHLRELGHAYGPEAGAFFYCADELEATAAQLEWPAPGWITWAECGVLAAAVGWSGDAEGAEVLTEAVDTFKRTVGLA